MKLMLEHTGTKKAGDIVDQCKERDRNYVKERLPLTTLGKTEEKQQK